MNFNFLILPVENEITKRCYNCWQFTRHLRHQAIFSLPYDDCQKKICYRGNSINKRPSLKIPSWFDPNLIQNDFRLLHINFFFQELLLCLLHVLRRRLPSTTLGEGMNENDLMCHSPLRLAPHIVVSQPFPFTPVQTSFRRLFFLVLELFFSVLWNEYFAETLTDCEILSNSKRRWCWNVN